MKRPIAAVFGSAASMLIATSVLAPVASADPAVPPVEPAAPTSKCQNIGNGDLCIEITDPGKNGHVKVWYTKKKGNPVKADLVWQTRTPKVGQIWGSTPVTMVVRPAPYSQTWPTYVAKGCTAGGIRPVNQAVIWGPLHCR